MAVVVIPVTAGVAVMALGQTARILADAATTNAVVTIGSTFMTVVGGLLTTLLYIKYTGGEGPSSSPRKRARRKPPSDATNDLQEQLDDIQEQLTASKKKDSDDA